MGILSFSFLGNRVKSLCLDMCLDVRKVSLLTNVSERQLGDLVNGRVPYNMDYRLLVYIVDILQAHYPCPDWELAERCNAGLSWC